jgi:two-component system, NarL family, sensor kinase
VKLEYIIVIGIAIMALMALSVVMFVVLHQRRVIRHQLQLSELESKKQIELFQAAAQSEEEERQRIAAELHDDIGATLASARLFLHQAEKTAVSPDLIRQSGMLVDESIRKVRDVSHKLQPATLQSLGLQSALEALADLYKRSGTVKFDVLPSGNLPRPDSHQELHVYRIVQELTNNILKHSKATFIVLQIAMIGDEQVLTIQHDGTGLNDDSFNTLVAQKGGIGLKNISSRLKFINGKITFVQQGANSFITKIKIPTTP